MTRRDLLTRITAVALVGVAPMASSSPYGPMDVDRWFAEGHCGKRVLCDGVDITNRCRWFDDTAGEAECFTTNPPTIDLDRDQLQITTMLGRIEVRQ